MYSLNMPVSKIRTKMRSEFEKHRFVNQLGPVDVLLFQSHSEFQVSFFARVFLVLGEAWMYMWWSGGRTARSHSRYDLRTRRRASCQFIAVGGNVSGFPSGFGWGGLIRGWVTWTYMIASAGRDRWD